MVEQLRLKSGKRNRQVGSGLFEDAGIGAEFDLSGDLTNAKAACRDQQGLADAIGMLTAIAGQRTRTSGFEKAVYILQVQDDPICKIGVSANPLQRIEDIQGSHYRELFLYAVVFCPCRNGVAIEQESLRRASAAGNRLLGEWVAMEPGDVLDMVFECAKDLNAPICDGKTYFTNMVNRTKKLYEIRARQAQVAKRFAMPYR